MNKLNSQPAHSAQSQMAPLSLLQPSRVILVLALIIGAIVALGVQIYQLNAEQGSRLKQHSQQRIYRQTPTIQARRGTLYDTNGVALAVDAYQYKIAIDPHFLYQLYQLKQQQKISDIQTEDLTFLQRGIQSLVARVNAYRQRFSDTPTEQSNHPISMQRRIEQQLHQVGKLLGYAPNELLQLVEQTHRKQPNLKHLVLAKGRKISSLTAYQLRKIKLKALKISRHYHRSYPHGESFASILGYLSTQNQQRQGMDGVERWLQNTLAGQAGSEFRLIGLNGQTVAIDALSSDVEAGEDVYLTLDMRYQYQLNKALRRQMVKHHAKSALGVIIDVRNGEIKAMASQPSFNPNDLSQRTNHRTRLRSVVDRFEPGSTQKPLLIAVALEHGIINDQTTFDIQRMYHPEGANRPFYENAYLGEQSTTAVLQYSINQGMAKLAELTPKQYLWNLMESMQYTASTDLRNGERGLSKLSNYRTWSSMDYFVQSYGYGTEINLLDLARFYVAIANQGVLAPLHLVQDKPLEKPALANDNKDFRSVLTAKTATKMIAMLERSITHGTGRRAQVHGYRVAGKTGTAELVRDGQYSQQQRGILCWYHSCE